MNILVTGAAGFVGGHLIKELQGNGHEVTATINNNENPLPGVLSIAADLMVQEEVNERINFKNIDAVIHLAGLAAVGPSFDEPHKYLQINAGIEINLYESCILQDSNPNFLIISSGTLYNPKKPMPINEESEVVPTSPYAVSKVAQESLAEYYSNRGFDYIIARPFNHIGPGQNPGFIVSDFVKQIVEAENGEIKEIMVGNLDAKRDYTDVRDIVRAYRLLVESGKTVNNTYNICSGNSVSGKEILDGLLMQSEANVTIGQDPARMRPSDTPEIIGDHSKITTDTGWEPTISLDQTLLDALDDWRSR
jgi:GDP-4-dehydro-6-deoxy-D-mannose reductase